MPDDYKVQLSLKKGEAMLNIRADHAAEFHSLFEELSGLDELGHFFSAGVRGVLKPVETEEAVAVSEVGTVVAAGGATSPASSPASGAKSALEIARERMKGVSK